jgi:hypothetical protein
MSGSELLKTLEMIDDNARANTGRIASEMQEYFQDNQSLVIEQLKASESVFVPTSVGFIEVKLSDLQAALDAQPIAA